MLAFLARLVPGARDAASGVRAALPARFAPREAGDALREDVMETRAAPARGRANDGPAAPHREGQSLPVAAFSPVLQAAREELRRDEAPPTLLPQRPEPPVPSFHSEAARPDPTDRDAANRLETRPQSPLAPSLERFPHVPAAAAAPLFINPPARPSSAIDTPPPLSAATLAHRTAAERAAAPTVVHVTIDRIDVRASASTVPERRSPERRRAAATVSLDDYLRQRAKAPRGGAGS